MLIRIVISGEVTTNLLFSLSHRREQVEGTYVVPVSSIATTVFAS